MPARQDKPVDYDPAYEHLPVTVRGPRNAARGSGWTPGCALRPPAGRGRWGKESPTVDSGVGGGSPGCALRSPAASLEDKPVTEQLVVELLALLGEDRLCIPREDGLAVHFRTRPAARVNGGAPHRQGFLR